MSRVLNYPGRRQKRKLRTQLMKKFGVNYDQYEFMLKDHNHVCAICQKADPCDRALAVDHDHTTNKIRGLLCTNCNMALGKFQDNLEYVKRAVAYMERDYVIPELPDTVGHINHNDRPNWKMIVTTPNGVFPSLQHAADYYQVHHTAIRSWCLPNSKWKKDGFECEKVFKSLNELKEYCDVKNQSV